MSSEWADKHEAERQAKLDLLRENGFAPVVIDIGGNDALSMMGGGSKDGAICMTCFCLVPILDMSDGTALVQRHMEWHDAS